MRPARRAPGWLPAANVDRVDGEGRCRHLADLDNFQFGRARLGVCASLHESSVEGAQAVPWAPPAGCALARSFGRRGWAHGWTRVGRWLGVLPCAQPSHAALVRCPSHATQTASARMSNSPACSEAPTLQHIWLSLARKCHMEAFVISGACNTRVSYPMKHVSVSYPCCTPLFDTPF